MDLWRISRFPDLAGLGGLKYSGRWHTSGHAIVYFADSLAAAMLEMLVHLEVQEDEIPLGYLALRVTVPNDLTVATLSAHTSDWQENIAATRKVGDAWLKGNVTALARVPSAVLQDTTNFLLNPGHPNAALLTLQSKNPLRFDPRLIKRVRRTT
jgi:RES domain-containing protein